MVLGKSVPLWTRLERDTMTTDTTETVLYQVREWEPEPLPSPPAPARPLPGVRSARLGARS
jgi:hypothetical protein